MKNVGISEPCSENWNEMTPNEKGAFCQKCATQVYDFTNKSNQEIKSTLKSLIGQPVCGRMAPAQEESLNMEFEAWRFSSKRSMQSAMVFSLIVVFGLTLFSCSNQKEEDVINQIQQSVGATVMVNSKDARQKVEEINSLRSELSLSKLQMERNIMDDKYAVIEHGCTLREMSQADNAEISYDVQAVSITQNRTYATGGAMMITTEYNQFLVAEIPVTEKDPLMPIELDANGLRYPNEYTSKVYPNPVSTAATLEMGIPHKNRVEINLFDLSGKHLSTIFSGELDRGTFNYQVDMSNLITGMYLVVIRSKAYSESIRVSKL